MEPEAEWAIIAALPNLTLQQPIESSFAALVPAQDKRIIQLRKSSRAIDKFASNFKDEFGRKIKPTFFIVRSSAPKTIWDTEAISAFRDCVTISVVSLARVNELTVKQRGVSYSNAFWAYPWSIGRDNQSLIANTATLIGIDDVYSLRPQKSPATRTGEIYPESFDEGLLKELLRRWDSHFARKRRRAKLNTALFRSLAMASAAAQEASSDFIKWIDLGRSIAMWVSACEIMAHACRSRVPASGKIPTKVSCNVVCDLLEKNVWIVSQASARRYIVHSSSRLKAQTTKSKLRRRSISSYVCGVLYRARNDFLHGEIVRPESLRMPGTRHGIVQYGAPLYRLLLGAALELKEPPGTISLLMSGDNSRSRFRRIQRDLEYAMLTSRNISLRST